MFLTLYSAEQIKIKEFSASGENLTFKIDGETSFGSRMEIQLPSGSEKTFKVGLIIQYLFSYVRGKFALT